MAAIDRHGTRAGYYVRGQFFGLANGEQAKARAEWLAYEHGTRVKVLHVQTHGGPARFFHHATGTRHK